MTKQILQPKLKAAVTPFASGALYLDIQSTNLSNATYWPAGLAIGDTVQIGVIPAGMVLVPQLSSLVLPKLDSNASPTGRVSIGTANQAAALLASTAVGTAASLFGAQLLQASIGSPDTDIPVLLTVTAAFATEVATGKIAFEPVLRAWRDDVDDVFAW